MIVLTLSFHHNLALLFIPFTIRIDFMLFPYQVTAVITAATFSSHCEYLQLNNGTVGECCLSTRDHMDNCSHPELQSNSFCWWKKSLKWLWQYQTDLSGQLKRLLEPPARCHRSPSLACLVMFHFNNRPGNHLHSICSHLLQVNFTKVGSFSCKLHFRFEGRQ